MPVLESEFSTLDFDYKERRRAWNEVISTVFDVSAHSLADTDKISRLHSYCYGDIILSSCESHGQAFERSARRLSVDPVDHFLIQLYLGGNSETKRGSCDVEVKPGDIFLLDMAEKHYANYVR